MKFLATARVLFDIENEDDLKGWLERAPTTARELGELDAILIEPWWQVNGERQVGTSLEEIRPDHVARYQWAAAGNGSGFALDFACGCGYGSKILADAGADVMAFDRCPESVEYAREAWGDDQITYRVGDDKAVIAWLGGCLINSVVCLETIEHLRDPESFLRAAARSADRLFISCPNEARFPWKSEERPHGIRWHQRHYTAGELQVLLTQTGWEPRNWYGQAEQTDGPVVPLEQIDGEPWTLAVEAESS